MNNNSLVERTRGIQLFKSHLEQDKGIRLFNVALRWTRSSLRVSIRMALGISPEECLQSPLSASFHCVERYSEPLLEEINVIQA